MIFLNPDEELATASKKIFEEELKKETLTIVGWRVVPTDPTILGEIAAGNVPAIEQIFVDAPQDGVIAILNVVYIWHVVVQRNVLLMSVFTLRVYLVR